MLTLPPKKHNTKTTPMEPAAKQAGMQTFMVSFNPKDSRAAKLIEALKAMDFLTIEKSPYAPAFVEKIKKSEKSKKHFVEVAKMWD